MSCGHIPGIRCSCAATSATATWWASAAARVVLTPEDPYPVWEDAAGPVTIAPLFLLYDYTFRPAGTATKEEGLAVAYETGVVGTDETVLHPDPYPSREAWCQARVELTEQRLAERDGALPTVLVNHWPLTREPTAILRYPQYAQWCGTTATGRLAPQVRRRGRRVRASAYPADDLAGRRPFRGSVRRLSARVEDPGASRARPAPAGPPGAGQDRHPPRRLPLVTGAAP